jgi:hypothetical protein
MEEGYSVSPAFRQGFLDSLAGMRKLQIVRYVEGKEVGIDCFLVTTEYQKAAFERRSLHPLNGRKAWIISVEDLILHKLVAGRDRDRADVGDILLMNPEADTAYLRTWAPVLGVDALLEKHLAGWE